MQTVFTEISDELYHIFAQYGFYYNSRSYINVYRWMWQEKNIKPSINNFITNNKDITQITFINPKTNESEVIFADGFDDTIIKSVDYIYTKISEYCYNNSIF